MTDLERVTRTADDITNARCVVSGGMRRYILTAEELLAFEQAVLAKRDEAHERTRDCLLYERNRLQLASDLAEERKLEIATLKQHNIDLMAIFQERDAKMQAAWSAYKARELYLQHKIDQIAHFSKSITAVATPAPESYLGQRIEDEQIY